MCVKLVTALKLAGVSGPLASTCYNQALVVDQVFVGPGIAQKDKLEKYSSFKRNNSLQGRVSPFHCSIAWY